MTKWMRNALYALAILAVAASLAAVVTPQRTFITGRSWMWYESATFANGDSVSAVDTLVWSSDRNFSTDTNYTTAVFVSAATALGDLRAAILDDSTVLVNSDTADSGLTYYYLVVQQTH